MLYRWKKRPCLVRRFDAAGAVDGMGAEARANYS
jgi:hypothetical protein